MGLGTAPRAGRKTRLGPRPSLGLAAAPLAKLPLSEQRNNLIQQDEENCQRKMLGRNAAAAKT